MPNAHDDDNDGDRGHPGSSLFRIEVLSSKPYMVSGGDALVRVTVKKNVRLSDVRVELNRADITGTFVADSGARTLTGLVSGLREGENDSRSNPGASGLVAARPSSRS